MDARLRELEHQWFSGGNIEDLNRLLNAMLQTHSLDEWEFAAENAESAAASLISQLRRYAESGPLFSAENDDLYEECWVNVYEDFTARSTINCYVSQASRIRSWLRNFYTRYQLFYPGWEADDEEYEEIKDPFDDIFGPIDYVRLTPANDPPAEIVINHSHTSCFRLWASELMKEAERRGIFVDEGLNSSVIRILSPINRWGQRDYPVSFQIIEGYPETDTESEEADNSSLPWWVNFYRTDQAYGGAEEGGWYYGRREPVASIYVGNRFFDNDPRLAEVEEFLRGIYSGPGYETDLQDHPALAEPHQRPFYE